jgi:hypothetical protein
VKLSFPHRRESRINGKKVLCMFKFPLAFEERGLGGEVLIGVDSFGFLQKLREE